MFSIFKTTTKFHKLLLSKLNHLSQRSASRLNNLKMSDVVIGTHNGKFHCDEVLACYILKLLPEYKNAKIVRSRDLSVLDKCDIVVDVGGKYDPKTHRYDHHMREFNESISTVIQKPGCDSTVKLSSAGLIYCHFGLRIIKVLIPEIDDEDAEKVFEKVYNSLIKEIDGIDNGIPMFDGEPTYRIVTGLSARVNNLNPHWNSVNKDEDQQFEKALELVGKEFVEFINYFSQVWLPAKNVVKSAVKMRHDIDPSGQIIVLDQMVPWKDHLYDVEKELNVDPTIKFVIFNDKTYRVQGVAQESGSFVCRIFLPKEWQGLRDSDLIAVSGIKECIFVHSNGFIGGNNTLEGALAMAKYALKSGNIKE